MSNTANRVTNPMKVITGPDTRWSYANVWEAKSINGGKPQYSISLIIPKDDTQTVTKVKAAIKNPLRDGDVERPDDPAYQNCYFINANNKNNAPGIVDANRQPIIDHSEVYSGVYGRASISFYAFNSTGNKGIACSLNNLQKIRDGEPLGTHSSAEDDFNDEDEDFLN